MCCMIYSSLVTIRQLLMHLEYESNVLLNTNLDNQVIPSLIEMVYT